MRRDHVTVMRRNKVSLLFRSCRRDTRIRLLLVSRRIIELAGKFPRVTIKKRRSRLLGTATRGVDTSTYSRSYQWIEDVVMHALTLTLVATPSCLVSLLPLFFLRVFFSSSPTIANAQYETPSFISKRQPGSSTTTSVKPVLPSAERVPTRYVPEQPVHGLSFTF